MEPLISVIVPIYKVEEYLDCCIESIVNQTYLNLEIILIDDGSPDNCPEICDHWAKLDNRIEVIHKENGGLSDARNTGLRKAKGEFICFVDSDDWIEKPYIEYLYDLIIKNDADLSACDVSFVSNSDSVKPKEYKNSVSFVCDTEEALSQLIKGKGFRAVAWNKLYKKSIISDMFFEIGKFHEDEFFTYRVIDKCKKLAYIDIPLYNYRQREGSIMNIVSERHLDALDASVERLTFFKSKYPELYISDCVTFCISCIGYYKMAVSGEFIDGKAAKTRIVNCRKKIKIPFSVFLRKNIKEKMKIVFSKPLFIGLFCRIQ